MKRSLFLIILVTLLLIISGLYAQEQLTVLHWNDFHARNTPYFIKSDTSKIQVGGYATLAGYIDSIRSECPHVALVNAGDDFQGSPISTITKGLSQIEILNLINPDVYTLGNHEFDYGKENLRKVIAQAKFPIISANLFDKSTGKLFVRPYLIKQYGNLKVGYIGLMTTELKQLTLPENVSQLEIIDPALIVNKYTTLIKDSVNIIIIVSHMGIEADEELALTSSNFNVIIGGHSHKALFEPEVVNNVIICQAGSKGMYLGRIDLVIDTENNKILHFNSCLIKTINQNVIPDPIVKTTVDSMEKQLDDQLNEVIGILKNDWIRDRYGESNIGDWQTDVIREFAETNVAFQNSGGIRKDLPAGHITLRDMWEITPFSNHFVVFKMKGTELKKTLEKNCEEGEFLQVSGIKYTYYKTKPAGSRVIEIWVNGKKMKDDAIYSVCSNNFLVDHFYSVFGVPPDNREFKNLNIVDRDVFIEAVKKQKVIESRVEGRIISIN